MAGFSKLTAGTVIGRALLNSKRQLQVVPIRQSHAHLFRKRPGQLLPNRTKDVVHFYVIGLGVLPCALVVFVSHILFGSSCELSDHPSEGHPHHWQFERTPLRQWFARHFGVSDAERHERNMALAERTSIISRWRRYEQRVKHLEGERWDYKGFYYEPVSSHWVDFARYQAERYRDKYEEHGHYPY